MSRSKKVNILHPRIRGLSRDFMAGKINRREMLFRASLAGAGAMTLSSLRVLRPVLAQDGDPIEPGSTLEVPEGLRDDLGGQRIATVQANETSPNLPFEEAAVAMFEEATGAEVQYVFGEQSATDRLQNYRLQFSAGSSDIDVYQIDVIWPGIVAPFALDLSDSLSDLADQHFEAIVQNNTVDGKLVGIPWFTDAGLLYYREDLLEEYGFEGPPETWAELEEMASTIQEGERADNPQFQGFVFQGQAYEGLTCNGLEWQVSNGGGFIIEQDSAEVSVNNEQAIAAFDQARGWVGNISPQDVVTFQEPDALNAFVSGNSAFMRNWPYAFAASNDEQQSQIPGLAGVGILPMGEGEGARNAACLGGWQLMVSEFSQNQDAAIEYVRFSCSEEVQRAAAIEISRLPTIADVYEDGAVAEASEFIPRLREIFEGGAVARPSTVSSDLYGEVSQVYFQELNQVLTGAKSGAEAAAAMEEEISQIMEDL